ncbi:putative laminarinase [Cristinia sonorae]|uniref:Laminarinase n=1 Tax=Cristinia sonorae TaxID=1940300 RepID=A0A8K0UGZ3_9AGAR|nr:putative laminarinase [Cristinia sonorae]
MRFLCFLLLAPALLSSTALAGSYGISDNIIGAEFLNEFVHDAIPDPTHGRVSAKSDFCSGNTFVILADSTTVLAPNGPGRNSVRIRSQKTYITHVSVFNIVHMPEGCGTWPAVWETATTNWPNLGEVDINSTTPGIYGPLFNDNRGGWYAMERTDNFIKVWFWPRSAGNVPAEVRSGALGINTDSWGRPSAFFPNTQCDLKVHFGPNNVIINLTFCGDWAGQPGIFIITGLGVMAYANENPRVFEEAYWQFNAVRVFLQSPKYYPLSVTSNLNQI